MKRMDWLVAMGVVLWGFSACGQSRTGGEATGGGGEGGSGGEVSDAVDLVSLCETAVAETCGTLSACCHSGAGFDTFECRRTQLSSCFAFLGLEQTGEGAAVYDREAARGCIRPLTACPEDYGSSGYYPYSWTFITPTDPEQVEACNRVQSGYRPLGSACYRSTECAAVQGDGYAECFYGPYSYYWGYYGDGVCAHSRLSSDGSCGFDPGTLEHKVCPPGRFCETVSGSGTTPDPYYPYPPYPYPPYEPPQGSATFAYEGRCQPLRGEGEPCSDPYTGARFDCAEGLFCNYDYRTGQERCVRPLREGESCIYSELFCGSGLYCDHWSDRCVVDSDPSYAGLRGGPFCYAETDATPVCGDGRCDRPGETEYTCPSDCSYCGDYVCAPGEERWCPEDCGYCGDRQCTWQEEGWCVEDCGGYCGDYYCGPDEEGWCIEDCGYCGDGYCSWQEEGWCFEDCGTYACLDRPVCVQQQALSLGCSAEDAACVCDTCSCQIFDCSLIAGCPAIVACMQETGCSTLASCNTAETCQSVIAAHGGTSGEAIWYAIELNGCRLSQRCPSCAVVSSPDGGS
jgi:hypothetical protein